MSQDNTREIIAKYNNKESINDVCKEYGVSSTVISRILKENKVEIRKKCDAAKLKNQNKGCNYEYFSEIDTENKAYILGLLLADGCIYKVINGQKSVNLALKPEDKYIVDFVAKELDTSQKVRFCRNSYAISILSDKMCEQLSVYGMVENKNNRILPKLSSGMMPHLVRGYFDGDGCVHYNNIKDNYSVSISSCNESILDDICKYLYDNGVSYMGKDNFDTYYEIRTHKQSNIIEIYNLLYSEANTFMSRKKDIFKKLYERLAA